MSPEDLKILQERVNANSIPRKDRAPAPATVTAPSSKVAKLALPQKSRSKGCKAKGEMELIIKGMFPEYEKEYDFTKGKRRFRSDFFIPSINTCIEYEGIAVNKAEGEHSGHTHIVGYSRDCDKYNLCQILGYKVLRYTIKNYMNMGADLWTLKYGVNGE